METETTDNKKWVNELFTLKNIVLAIIAVFTAWNTYYTTVTKNKLDIATMPDRYGAAFIKPANFRTGQSFEKKGI